MITTEKQLRDIYYNENLDFEKYNYITCRGGKIKFIKTKLDEYLFKDKKKVIVYVNKVGQNDVYIYKIKKINLIHDLEAAPTYVID